MFQAISLNNAGASSLGCGDYAGAIICLAEALQTFSTWPCEEILQQHLLIAGLINQKKKRTIDRNLDMDSDSPRFVYKDPIMIPACYSLLPSYQSNVTVTVTIVFNLALAHHLCAMELFRRPCRQCIPMRERDV